MSKGGVENQESGVEKGSRWLRNFNIAVGAGALAVGAAVGSELLKAYGIFNFAQAGFFEVTRRWGKRRKLGKSLGKTALQPA